MIDLKLTSDEALLLDGRVNEKAQSVIEGIKQARAISAADGCDEKMSAFIARVVQEATNSGKLIFRHENIRHCDVCDKRGGYWPYPRTSRSHRKGEPNYDKPRTMSGVELADRFIRMSGYASLGCCSDCWAKAKPIVSARLSSVRAEIHESITGIAPRFKKYDNRKCKKCGWRGHEGQLGMLPAVMGGRYPGKCPSCGAENILFCTTVEHDEGFVVVELAGATNDRPQ